MDDHSMNSKNYTTTQSSTSRTQQNSSEESGWTLYFEDFITNNNFDNMDDDKEHAYSFSCSGYQNSSMVSDAGFRKFVGNNSSKLVSKSRKVTAKKVVDEELEDTASSPCHSPKVNDLNQLYVKSKELCAKDVCQVNYSNSLDTEHTKNKYYMDFSQEKNGQSSEHAREGIKKGYLETQLRRKGLCLVPMSMLINNIT